MQSMQKAVQLTTITTYTIDCVAAQKLYFFMQSRPVLDRQEHVLHRNKCGNLMLTLRSCFPNKFLTSSDKYFTPNYFKLKSLSDDITFVYVKYVIVIVLEHPISRPLICLFKKQSL